MLFNSQAFAIFLPTVLLIYWALRKQLKIQNLLLVVASYFFYGWWDWRFLSLLLVSTVVDYSMALAIARAQKEGRKGGRYLFASLFVNLGLLGVFKYYNFFIGSAEKIWEALGWSPGLLGIALPVGISFYTFQTMAYTIDVYRGKATACRSLVVVAAYVAFFPQLVAGPIERASTLIGQLERQRSLTLEGVRLGLMLILVGFLKKTVLADGISAPVVEWVHGRLALGEAVNPAEILLGMYAFSLQIYGDFSGYSNIARGAARLLGIELVINFKQPYFSLSHTQMWRRWHISLSFWLRDYLYILALGGNKGGIPKKLRNLALTMLLGGLWHGAAWTFVVWGALHGVYLVVENLLGVTQGKDWSIPRKVVAIGITFHLWTLAMLPFRAVDLPTAWFGLSSLVGSWTAPSGLALFLVLLGFLLVLLVDWPHLRHPDEELPAGTRGPWLQLTLGLALVGFYMFPPVSALQFIYFQF